MKKNVIFLLMIAIGFVACTNDYPIEDVQSAPTENLRNNSNRRSYTEAVEIAKNSLKILQEGEGSAVTRGGENVRTLNLESGVKTFCQTRTRSIENGSDNDTLLYVFNFEDEQGFTIVSANRQTEEIIAVVETGSYDPDIPTGNPGFDTYMQMAKIYVANAGATEEEVEVSSATSSQEIQMCKPVYDTIYHQKIDPKIYVRWGQNGRMGQYCSNGISGCSNTAAAQIMSYYQYPSSITLTFEGRDANSTALNWTAMNAHRYSDISYNRDEADLQIGRLARQLGKLANSTYGSAQTSTTIYNSREAFLTLGYNVGNIEDYEYRINDNAYDPDAGYTLANKLAQDKLIFMGGVVSGSSSGHAWVIDGCHYTKALHRMMCTYDGENWVIYQELGTNRTCLNHINWGWNGYQNGYFESHIFDVYRARSYDVTSSSQTGGNDYNFCNNVRYFTVSH